MHDAPHLNDRR